MLTIETIKASVKGNSIFNYTYGYDRTGFLTPEQALDFFKKSGNIITIESYEYVIFTDHSAFLKDILNSTWEVLFVEYSDKNRFNNVEEIITEVWLSGRQLISTVDQLVDILNSQMEEVNEC